MEPTEGRPGPHNTPPRVPENIKKKMGNVRESKPLKLVVHYGDDRVMLEVHAEGFSYKELQNTAAHFLSLIAAQHDDGIAAGTQEILDFVAKQQRVKHSLVTYKRETPGG